MDTFNLFTWDNENKPNYEKHDSIPKLIFRWTGYFINYRYFLLRFCMAKTSYF